MNTTVSTALVLPDRSHPASTPLRRLIVRLRHRIITSRARAAQPATREELAALYQRRLVAARLQDERFRDPTAFRIL